jgi:hypothetical protein
MLPHKTIRRMLKEYIDGDISKEAIFYIQSVLDALLQEICQRWVEEQSIVNSRRLDSNLLPVKRYHLSSCRRVTESIINQDRFNTRGEGGQVNFTPLSRGIEMQKQKPMPKVAGQDLEVF